MADVLIVCVREDEPQAKALADMFEAAGFSIGGAPNNDAALRSSGAGVVVWSQASIRSRPFLDAAQRVINANKAVVASLIEPPPPSSIGDALAFDLSRWSGDPDDPSLDPLFFAVDRMVNAARAAVGAPAAEPSPQAFEPPPSLRPPPRQAPRPEPRPAPPPQAHDALGSEAEHWRAIRNSRDPAVFLDYLSRYGQDGAFADVAELRLKQLTEGGARAAAPMPRMEPPRRAPEPAPVLRRPDPPTQIRRVEPPREPPPPPRRRDPLPPQPGFEQRFDRHDAPPPREAPQKEGGALRAFILIAILGGAALAGGLYFGGTMGDNNAAENSAEVSAPPVPTGGDTESGDVQEGTAFSDVARPGPAPAQPRRETAQTREPERERPRPEPQQARQQPPAPTTTTVASNTTTTSSGGPVSLSPGSTTPSQTTTAPPPAAVVTPPPAPIQTAATPPAARPAGTVSWAQRPSARRISDVYPERALRDGVGARVELDCTVLQNLSLTCSVANESPAGLGFGRAAMSASGSYRARPALSDGQSAVGARTRIVVQFQAPAQ